MPDPRHVLLHRTEAAALEGDAVARVREAETPLSPELTIALARARSQRRLVFETAGVVRGTEHSKCVGELAQIQARRRHLEQREAAAAGPIDHPGFATPLETELR